MVSAPKGKGVVFHHNVIASANLKGTKMSFDGFLREFVPTLASRDAGFKPTFSLSSGHLHTMYASVLFKKHAPIIRYKDVSLVMADGGNCQLSLAPVSAFGGDPKAASTPIVVILHGILGTSQAPYITTMVERLIAPRKQGGAGVRVAVMTLRGCGDLRMTSPTIHHAQQTQDLSAAILWLALKYPQAPRFGIGCSMGANILINYLGDRGLFAGVSAGMAISPVPNLPACFDRLRSGSILDRHIINRSLGGRHGDVFKRNIEVFDDSGLPWMEALGQNMAQPTRFAPWLSPRSPASSNSSSTGTTPYSDLFSSRSLTSMSRTTTMDSPEDMGAYLAPPSAGRDAIAAAAMEFATNKGALTMTRFSGFVAHVIGYKSVDDFTDATSPMHSIPHIRTPLLMLNAWDDPMMPGEHLPFEAIEKNPFVALAMTAKGGHLGWIAKEKQGGRRVQWHVEAVVEWVNGLVDIGAKHQTSPVSRSACFGEPSGMTYEEGRSDVGFMEVSKSFLNMIPFGIKKYLGKS